MDRKFLQYTKLKYLCMYLDEYLSWEIHINQLSVKLRCVDGILAKLCHFIPEVPGFKYIMLYSIHIYIMVVLFGLTTERSLDVIRKLQKECVRILFFSDFRCHTDLLFYSLNLLKVDNIIKFSVLDFVYDFRHNFLPDDLKNIFTYRSNVHITD